MIYHVNRTVFIKIVIYSIKEGSVPNCFMMAYETALLKIQNDIALSVESGKAVALTLLDLFAAFDMIDHSLLYDCLHDWFGPDGTVLLRIKSYLSNCKQKIKIGDSFSEAVILLSESPKAPYWVLSFSLFTLVPSVKLLPNSISLINYMLMTPRST